MKLPTNWEELWEYVQKQEHKGLEGVPSASSLDRTLTCSGSFFLPRTFEDTEATIKGSCIHWCLEHNWVPDDMPEDDLWVYESSKKILDQVIYDTGFNCKYQVEPFYETNWLTGSMDLVMIKNADKKEILVLDWKTGRIEVDPRTKQLGGYAALIFDKHPETEKVHGMIVQPLATFYPEMVTWTREKAQAEIRFPLEALRDNPELFKYEFNTSVKGCRFCPHALSSNCEATKNIFTDFITTKGVA